MKKEVSENGVTLTTETAWEQISLEEESISKLFEQHDIKIGGSLSINGSTYTRMTESGFATKPMFTNKKINKNIPQN
ncbi:MAG: hypothetical protein QY322_00045 [bacterium]|nr:MAG: hypothetical protein QY322_00045 [bacterium]